MTAKTVKHANILVSLLSEDMANHFKDKVTPAQYELLKHNVYGLEKSDTIYQNYRGCGGAWVEIDQKGEAVNLKYILEEIAVFSNDEQIIVPSQDIQRLYLESGQTEQSVLCLDFHTDQLAPLVLPNGNIRLLVNCSCYELVRF